MENITNEEGKIIEIKVTKRELDKMSDNDFCEFILDNIEKLNGNVIDYAVKRLEDIIVSSNSGINRLLSNIIRILPTTIAKTRDNDTGMQLISFDNDDFSFIALLIIEMVKTNNNVKGKETTIDDTIIVKQLQHCIEELSGEKIISLEI